MTPLASPNPTRVETLDASLLAFWGKTGDADDGGVPRLVAHPLAYHLLDVAACADAVFDAAPDRLTLLATFADTSPEKLRGALLFLIAAHDIGKAARGFQGKAPDFWPTALGPAPEAGAFIPVRHDAAGLWLFLNEPRLRRLVERVTPGLLHRDRIMLLQSVVGHHGEPLQWSDGGVTAVANPGRQVGPEARAAAAELAESLFALFSPEPLSPPDDAVVPFSFMLAGLAVLADWLGSNRRWFAFAPQPAAASLDAELARYWREVARPAARRAIMEAGLAPSPPAPFAGLKDLFPFIQRPSPLQTFAETARLPDGPALFVIEDMTGSGKTEVAVTLAHRLLAEGRARGVHVALPTMATANAMFARLAASYRRLFAPDASPSVVLVHARRDLCEGFRTLTGSLSYDDVHREGADPSETTASAFCADWIARSRKQAFLAQMGAGTIDQALLAILPSRHQALRLWGLADKVLVIDEAHAYDAYMTKELETLLRFHAAFGGSAIVLSATLPRRKRRALIEAYRQGLGETTTSAPRSLAYPLASVASHAELEERPLGLRENLAREVPVEFVETLDAAHAVAVKAARAGAAVALIRNTVDEAIASYVAIKAEFGDATLFHARFALADRLAAEEKALEKFGPRADVSRAGVLVATQVIEQSLDLDFDLIVTDLAPVDLLIQRAGRLWRHMDKRPATTRAVLFKPHAPTLVVLSAAPTQDADEVWLDKVLPKTRFVYRDAALLWRSAKLLRDAGMIVSRTSETLAPAASGEVRALIESAYGDDRISIPSGLEDAGNKAWGNGSAERSMGARNVLRFEAGYDFDGGRWESDDGAPTRLSDETLTLRLARLENGCVVPWARVEDGDMRRAWSLSEVSVRLNRCSGVALDAALAAALERAKKEWTLSERDTPVVVMREEAEGRWSGRILDGAGKEAAVHYSVEKGFEFD